MTLVRLPVVAAAVFLWVGFVAGISFLEAPLKFQAPGITLPLGLGIGRLVFGTLNKVEWVLSLAISVNLIYASDRVFRKQNILYLIVLLILIIQTVWLLPALDARAEMIINHQDVHPSNNHFYYVGMELLKVLCLTVFGITLFKSPSQATHENTLK